MLAVLLRFRVYDKVFAFDLSKAYNTMRTSVQERHLRRFVWRWTEDCPWIDLGLDRVHFGDIGAASELQVSKGFVADLGACIDEEASEKLVEDSYVDDTLTGGDAETVERMVGQKDESEKFDRTI